MSIQRVVAAMPGTLTELSARTRLSFEQVLSAIVDGRAAGVRIFARRDPAVEWVNARERPLPAGTAITTIYEATA